MQTAQANVGNSEQAAQGAQQELAEKTQLMEAAKNRVEQLLRQLSAARTDFVNTKQAAYKASASAHEAKVNAARNRRNTLRQMRHQGADADRDSAVAAARQYRRSRRRRSRRLQRRRHDDDDDTASSAAAAEKRKAAR